MGGGGVSRWAMQRGQVGMSRREHGQWMLGATEASYERWVQSDIGGWRCIMTWILEGEGHELRLIFSVSLSNTWQVFC